LSIIKLEGIIKTYLRGKTEVPALRSISFEIERGDLISAISSNMYTKSFKLTER